MYFSDKKENESMGIIKTESDLFDMDILEEEEQLVVEREIMMSILGKFIDDKDINSISIDSDVNNDTQIKES